MSDPVIKLTASQNGLTADLPVLKGTEGPDVIDIRSLNNQTGMFTYDPGFVATASCRSSITYIDGDKGILRYRGYPIEQLAAQCSFLEVAFLLLYGELPNETELGIFRDCIKKHLMINESLTKFFQGFRYDSHPMAMLVGVMSSLSAFYHDALDITDPQNRQISAHRMIAKVATIAAAAHKRNEGEPFMYPQNHLSYPGNFLHMMLSLIHISEPTRQLTQSRIPSYA